MSQNETNPAASATIDALGLFIDSRIEQHQPTTEEIAEAVAPLLEIPDPDSLSESQVRQVITLIAEHAPPGDRDGSTIDPDPDPEPDPGGGGASDPFGEEYRNRIDEELLRMRLSSDPTHKATIDTGLPSGDYHPFGDWGNVLTVHEPVHWESAVIDAQSAGVTRLRIREIDFEAPTVENGSYVTGGKYDLGGITATRDIHHGSGPQEIYPEVTLSPGQYFVDRDPEAVVPMRKISNSADFDAINAGHRAPVEIGQSWRSVPSYLPGGDSYEEPYISSGWHTNLYYFANPQFGFMDSAAAAEASESARTAEGDPVKVSDVEDEDAAVPDETTEPTG